MIQMDEMWSYVGSKANKQWIWLAIDATTREIVGVHIGDRSSQSAKQLCPLGFKTPATIAVFDWVESESPSNRLLPSAFYLVPSSIRVTKAVDGRGCVRNG